MLPKVKVEKKRITAYNWFSGVDSIDGGIDGASPPQMRTMSLPSTREQAGPAPRTEMASRTSKLADLSRNPPSPPTRPGSAYWWCSRELVGRSPAGGSTNTHSSWLYFSPKQPSYLHYWQPIMRRRKSGTGSCSQRDIFLPVSLCLGHFGRTFKGTVKPIWKSQTIFLLCRRYVDWGSDWYFLCSRSVL